MNSETKAKNIITPHKISAPELSSVTYGADIEDVFRKIDENFSKLVNSDFLRGHQGDSLFVKSYTMKNTNDVVFDAIRETIYHKYTSTGTSNPLAPLTVSEGESTRDVNWWDYLIKPNKPERQSNVIHMVHALVEQKDESGLFTGSYFERKVSSLPFIVKDARFSELFESKHNYDSNDMGSVQREDISCVIQFTGMVSNPYYGKINPYLESIRAGASGRDERKEIMHFEILDVFPTLYYDAFQQNFCWKVWGDKTGIVANGPKGADGKPGEFVVVIRDYSSKDSGNNFYIKWLITEDGSTVGVEGNTANLYNGAMAIILPDNGDDKKLNDGSYWVGRLKYANGRLKTTCADFNKISPKFDSQILSESLIDKDFPGYYIPTDFGVNNKGTGGYVIRKNTEKSLDINYVESYNSQVDIKNTDKPINIYGPVNLVCGNNNIKLDKNAILLTCGDVSLKVSNAGVQIGKGGKFEDITTTPSAV